MPVEKDGNPNAPNPHQCYPLQADFLLDNLLFVVS